MYLAAAKGGAYQLINVHTSHGQVFTGLIPFESCRAEPTVMLKIINGDRPTQPVGAAELGLTDGLWRLIRCAWAEDAQKRPPVGTIVEFLLQEP